MLLCLSMLALVLSGSSCTPLVTKVDTVEVPVTIVQSCIDPADIPVIPKSAAVKDGNMVQDAAAASRDARVYRQKAEEAVNLLKICAEQP